MDHSELCHGPTLNAGTSHEQVTMSVEQAGSGFAQVSKRFLMFMYFCYSDENCFGELSRFSHFPFFPAKSVSFDRKWPIPPPALSSPITPPPLSKMPPILKGRGVPPPEVKSWLGHWRHTVRHPPHLAILCTIFCSILFM